MMRQVNCNQLGLREEGYHTLKDKKPSLWVNYIKNAKVGEVWSIRFDRNYLKADVLDVDDGVYIQILGEC